MIRFPKECLRCGRRGHLPKDCPLGKSQQERDFDAMVRGQRNALVLCGLSIALTLMLFGLLERVPS